MTQQTDKPLFAQIAERLCDDILAGRYAEGDRVPSVRELAAEFEVNVNTVLRSFDILQREAVLQQQRGIGMVVVRGARRRIAAVRKKDFLQRELPDFFRRLDLLGFTIDDVVEEWRKRAQ